MDNEFRTDQTVNVDINLSREEVLRLGRERPFWNFVNFPLEIGPKPEPIKMVLSDKTYSFPKDADFTEKIDVTPLKLTMVIKPKETYISPFSGRVM